MARQFSFSRIGVLPWLGMLLVVASCNKEDTSGIPEDEDSAFKSAMTLKNGDGDKKARSLEDFLKVIDQREAAPKSHMQVGLLYLDRDIGDPDPISAIYHFKKYLEYIPDPDSEQGRRMRGQIDRAERLFMARLPGDPYQTNGDNAMQLEELIKRLQDENQQLRVKLNQVTNRTEEFPLQDNQQTATLPRTRVYKVTTGDTLFKIASKVYGDPARWREIFEANRQVLKRENDLQPGQELLIP
jgi:hypothetical protein